MIRASRLLRSIKSRRALALSLAAVVLGGQLAGFAHLVLVAHVTCAEHGELVEVGHTPRRTVARDDGRTHLTDAGEASEQGHEHCTLAPHRRDGAMDVSRVDFVAAVAPLRSAAWSATVSPRGPPIALLHLAPKSSPPAAPALI
jgi:hypothetical protein